MGDAVVSRWLNSFLLYAILTSGLSLAVQEEVLPICDVKLNVTSAKRLQRSFLSDQPNFARLQLRFNGQMVNYTQQVILPFHWVWTYYDNHYLAYYLKWPNDFPLLSFGLLDAKTLTDGHYIELEIPSSKCRLTIGEYNSTVKIADALKELTEDYLMKAKKESPIDYSYWCYMVEVPNRKNTISYKLRAYTSYPAEMMGYRCCHTYSSIQNETLLQVKCSDRRLEQTIESSLLPYCMSLVAFVVFPIFLLNASNFVNRPTSIRTGREQYRELIDVLRDSDDADFIFLDGSPPISFTTIMTGFCGLSDKFPLTISRIRRFIFLALAPSVVLVKVFIYRKYMYDMVMAMLKHECPIGFVAMIGGYQRSRAVFLTSLGGPYIVLAVFYLAGIFFIILPSHLDQVFEMGSNRVSDGTEYTLVSLSVKTIETYSLCKVNSYRGYAKAAALCSAGVFMVLNPMFWCYVITMQVGRLKTIRRSLVNCMKPFVGLIILVLILPFYFVICLCETAFVIFFYGFPIIMSIRIYVLGLTLSMFRLFETHSAMTKLGKCARLSIGLIVGLCFAYYVFGFCTIFTETFVYIAKTLFFSFMSVIVYPSTSFGYLFFGIVLLFYLVKSMTGFGEVYIELLAEAVDISCHLEDDPGHVQIIDDMLLVTNTKLRGISKIQIQDTVIHLSENQQNSLQAYNIEPWPKVKHRDHMIGIPKELFEQLVRNYQPVHKEIILTFVRVLLIILLIVVTFGIISRKPLGSNEDISEVMHVVFLMAVGALPKILEIALENINHSVKKEIQSRRIKADIIKYWKEKTDMFPDNI